ncbi:MAG: glutaredoxin family protein [Chloroflexota bacterium]|nr:glutaredoxin family protein [Chloroflexota bacterium]
MPEARGSIPGTHNKHHIVFYGLSTCTWCKRTRQFLEDQDVAFDYTYVDLLKGQEREAAVEKVRRWNSAVSFPTLVVDDGQCIVGYKTDKLKEMLGL